MLLTSLLTATLAAGASYASPVKRDDNIDVEILNYALTLEFLERKFYAEGLQNYTQADFVNAGFADPFYANLQTIASDERTHVDFINKAIVAAGAQPVHEATYLFPSTDVKSFITLASIFEGVGVSAYLGAAGKIVNKDYLTVAGSILTIEARHTSYLRSLLQESPFPTPFDTPLDFNEVFSLAAMFITGFAPGDPPLPFKAFPPLTLGDAPGSIYVEGMTGVTFKGAATAYPMQNGQAVFAAFFSGLTPSIVPVTVQGSDYKVERIPDGVAGQAYVVLTKDNATATDETILAGPAVLEIKNKMNETAMAAAGYQKQCSCSTSS
ncbi:MAG: hypothetical protein M1826_001330 [Phylliscum demangeonii]|nr:MAG: hypothetical protein M1826_001330 [Phylliscum demangeonii]